MAIAQTPWVLPGNNSINPSTDYLGTQNNVELVLRTNNLERFKLNSDLSYAVGAGLALPRNGYLGLSPSNSLWSGGPGPFTRLHLHDDGQPQQGSYRDWMRNGITLTGNQDHGYIGQKFGALDFTDMVIHWSDNPGVALMDRMRFIFTSGFDAMKTSGAESEEGLEFMRMWPNRYEDPHIGVGDFYAANLA